MPFTFPSPLYRLRLCTLVAVLAITGSIHAQPLIPRLKCQGEMPDDFKLRYSEKYENTLRQEKEAGGRRAAKRRRDFMALTTIAIDNLFRTGKVLYGDEVTVYCNKVLDSLLVDQPELRKELRLYTLRSNEVNAFSTHQGVIMVTVGLVARLESEAQLAFILAHEIGHYVKKHNLESYEYNKELFREDMRNRRSSFNEKLLESASYSREAEFEADAYGWDLYIRAGYKPEEAVHTHDLLLYSYLPLCNRHYEYGELEDEHFRVKPNAKQFDLIPIEADEDVDDTKSTHPNTYKRKALLKGMIENSTALGGNTIVFKIDQKEFEEVVQKARLDLVYNHLINNEYVEAMMLCDAWLDSSSMDRTYLNNARAMSFYGLQCLANKGESGHLRTVDLQGDQRSYFQLFRKLNPVEMNVVACREIWKIYQLDTLNVSTKALFNSSLLEMAKYADVKADYFSSDKDGGMGLEEQNEFCYTCKTAFKAPGFSGLEAEWILAMETLADKKYASRQIKREEDNEKPPLAVKRMIVLSPRYFGMDLRKPVNKRFLNADKKQLYMEETTIRLAKQRGIEVVVPDSRNERQSLTDDFNNYATLIDWMNEGLVYEGNEFRSYLKGDMEQIAAGYNADYLSLPMCWNLLEKRKFNAGACALSLVVPYAFPFYLYWQLTPRSQMAYAFLVMNLKTGNMEYAEVWDFNARYRDYLLKAHLYHSLNQIGQ